MARELRRLLISPERLRAAAGQGQPRLTINDGEAHYLRRVLRLGRGDLVAVVDGQGQLWSAELAGDGTLLLQQPLAAPLQQQPAPQPLLVLAMAVPRRDGELVWRMATEIGVDVIRPLVAEFSQVGAQGAAQGNQVWPVERWRTIVREATEQCERLWLPRLETPCNALEWLAAAPEGLGLIATTRQTDLPLLEELLARELPPPPANPATASIISLAIGPEGGWSERELAAAQAAGWRAVSLGEAILRTSTAAIAAVSRLAAWRQLSCASCPSPSP
jgi:16S rRNA (uracil1498-N3)-methyltransferase